MRERKKTQKDKRRKKERSKVIQNSLNLLPDSLSLQKKKEKRKTKEERRKKEERKFVENS